MPPKAKRGSKRKSSAPQKYGFDEEETPGTSRATSQSATSSENEEGEPQGTVGTLTGPNATISLQAATEMVRNAAQQAAELTMKRISEKNDEDILEVTHTVGKNKND